MMIIIIIISVADLKPTLPPSKFWNNNGKLRNVPLNIKINK